MSLKNLNNWFNLITGRGREAKSLKDNDVVAIGRPNSRSFNGFNSIGIRAKHFKDYLKNSGNSGGLSELSLKLSKHPVEQQSLFYSPTESILREFHQKALSTSVPTVRLNNGNLAEMYYVQFIMPDGTLVFEAYDHEAEHSPGNNGYWIAMKEVDGALAKVSELPMSDVFWNYWYDWSAPLEDNQIALIWSASVNSSSKALESSKVVLKYTDVDGLTLVSEQYHDYGGETVGSLLNTYYGITGTYTTQRAEPMYSSNNSYYEMQMGAEAGWVWFGKSGDIFQCVGFNLFTFQIKTFDLNTSPEFAAVTNLTGIISVFDYESLGETGLTFLIINGGLLNHYDDSGLLGFWSPYTPDTTKVSWIKSRWAASFEDTNYIHHGFIDVNVSYGYSGKYFYDIEISPDRRADGGQVAKITRHEIGVDNDPEITWLMLPQRLGGNPFTTSWEQAFGLMFMFPRTEGMAFATWFDTRTEGRYGELILLNWNNNSPKAEVLHSSQMWPSHMIGDKTIGKDMISLTARNEFAYPVLIETFDTQL